MSEFERAAVFEPPVGLPAVLCRAEKSVRRCADAPSVPILEGLAACAGRGAARCRAAAAGDRGHFAGGDPVNIALICMGRLKEKYWRDAAAEATAESPA